MREGREMRKRGSEGGREGVKEGREMRKRGSEGGRE